MSTEADVVPLKSYLSGSDQHFRELLQGSWGELSNTETSMLWHLVDDYISLETAISVNAKAEYTGIVLSSEFSTEIVTETTIDQHNVLFMAVSQNSKSQTVSGISLIGGGELPYKVKNADDFIQNYGDTFEYERRIGAIYVAIYRFYSSTATEAATVKAMLSGSSGELTAEVAADVTKKVESMNIKIDCKSFSLGFSPTKISKDINSIYSNCEEAQKLKSPDATLLVKLQKYSPSYVSGISSVDHNTDYFTDKEFNFLVGGSAPVSYTFPEIKMILSDLRDKSNDINRVFDAYGIPADEMTKSLALNCSTALSALDDQRISFLANPTQPLSLPDIVTVVINQGTPSLSVSLVSTTQFGRDGVNPSWPFITVEHSHLESWIEDENALINIVIGQSRNGYRVQKITTTTQDRNNNETVWASGPPNWVPPYPASYNVKWQSSGVSFINFIMSSPTSLTGIEIVKVGEDKKQGEYCTVIGPNQVLLGFVGFCGTLGDTDIVCQAGALVAELGVHWKPKLYFQNLA